MPSWYPGEPGNRVPAPHYSSVPIVRIADNIVLARPRRAAYWRLCRDEALALWEPSGLSFAVQEAPPPLGGLTVDAITLRLMNLPQGINGQANFVPPPNLHPTLGAGWVAIDRARFGFLYLLYLTKLNRGYARKKLRQYLAHEVGHTLGLDHGGNGIMMGALKPNDEELDAIRNYYL